MDEIAADPGSVLDVHAHFVPPRAIEEARRRPDAFGVGVETLSDGRARLAFPGSGWTRPMLPKLVELRERRRGMAAGGVGQQLLAPWMDVVGYALAPETGRRWSRLLNTALAEALAEDGSGAFAGVATVPLQDPAAAAAELEHAVGALGLAGVQIGTNVLGAPLGAAGLDPFWAAAVAARTPVILHPWHVAGEDRLGAHGLLQLLGYPFDTTLAAAFASVREQLAAERRGALKKQPRLVDIEADAIRREARSEALCHMRGKFSAKGGGADQDYFRLLTSCQPLHQKRVGFHAVFSKPGIVGEVNSFSAVGDIFVDEFINPAAQHNNAYLGVYLQRQLARPGD